MIEPNDINQIEDLSKEIVKYIKLLSGAKASGNFFDSEWMKEYGGPTGIAKHPKYGWAFLGCGQGPFIVWSEQNFK